MALTGTPRTIGCRPRRLQPNDLVSLWKGHRGFYVPGWAGYTLHLAEADVMTARQAFTELAKMPPWEDFVIVPRPEIDATRHAAPRRQRWP
jgi:hypothetical protein